MKVLINTLFHGDKKTKALLWTCLAAVIAGIVLTGVFAVSLSLPWMIGGVISFLIPLIVIRNYDFSDKMGSSNTNTLDIPENTIKNEREGKTNETVPEVSEKTKQKPVKIQKEKRKENPQDSEDLPEIRKRPEKAEKGHEEAEREAFEKAPQAAEEDEQDIQLTEVHKQVREEAGEGLPEKDEKAGKSQIESEEESRKGSEREVKNKKKDKLPASNKRGIKQLMFKYKVKREHKPVIIDSSIRWKVEKCPAYMWMVRGKAHFLLMEESPREIVIDAEPGKISYAIEKADSNNEYSDLMNNALFMQLFGDCLPTYHDEFINRRKVITKNLYLVDDDIKLTNTSARAAFDLMKASFELPESYDLPENVGSYTREANKTKILWQDSVITTNEFKTKTKQLLQEMTESDLSGRDFDKNLFEMVNRQLITKEYAEYYADLKRDENTSKKDKTIRISNF